MLIRVGHGKILFLVRGNIYWRGGQEKISTSAYQGKLSSTVGNGKFLLLGYGKIPTNGSGENTIVLVREKYLLQYSVGQGKISTIVLVRKNIYYSVGQGKISAGKGIGQGVISTSVGQGKYLQ